MIVEALQHALTPCPVVWRRMGYLHGMIAVQARHRRNRAAWAPHLEASAAQVLAAAEACAGRDLAVVLGAGLLLDVPLDALAERFRRVVLVDLCWLAATRLRARRYANVALLTHDVTGLAAACHRADGLPTVPPGDLPFAAEADLVCSLNILSQLPLHPRQALARAPGVTGAMLDAFGRAVIAAHVEALSAVPGVALLVTDVRAERVLKTTGAVLSQDLLHGHPHPAGGDSWTWDIAPAPEEDRRYDLRHVVMAGRV